MKTQVLMYLPLFYIGRKICPTKRHLPAFQVLLTYQPMTLEKAKKEEKTKKEKKLHDLLNDNLTVDNSNIILID